MKNDLFKAQIIEFQHIGTEELGGAGAAVLTDPSVCADEMQIIRLGILQSAVEVIRVSRGLYFQQSNES